MNSDSEIMSVKEAVEEDLVLLGKNSGRFREASKARVKLDRSLS